MKSKKFYSLPAQADMPIIDSPNSLSIWDNEKADGKEVELPKWLWECINKKCEDRYKDGRRDLAKEIREKLGS